MGVVARRFLHPVVMLVCVLVPPMVTNRGWWVVGRSGDGYSEPLEVLGTMVSAAVLLYWYLAYRNRGPDRAARIVVRLVTGAIVLQFLLVMVSYWGTSWDYRCYDAAARNFAKGLNPYDNTSYLYPPLLAESMAMANRVVEASSLFTYDNVTSWWLVFYFYQAAQLLLVFVVVEWLFAYTQRLELPLLWATVTVVATVLVDTPLFSTVRYQQTNLVVLAAVVYSLVWLRERPVRCAVLMAIGVMVKPLGILFPVIWLLIGARKAALAFLAAAAVLVVAQAGFGTDWHPWRQFIDSISRIPKFNDFFRNQSLFSVVSTILHTLRMHVDKSYVLYAVRMAQLVILGWFAVRFIDRERRFRAFVKKAATNERDRADFIVRIGGHTIDATVLALLCAPIVWDHHYAIVAAVVPWIVALGAGRIPRRVLIALILMFVPSTFDVWLFSYHRLAGVFLLAFSISPARVFELYVRSRKEPVWGAVPSES